ncbi:MAG: hypothetical protein LC808_23870, partial [Actinobacteria bacterium]|nr:hypothetical protein [Actinomycetota bacterium]
MDSAASRTSGSGSFFTAASNGKMLLPRESEAALPVWSRRAAYIVAATVALALLLRTLRGAGRGVLPRTVEGLQRPRVGTTPDEQSPSVLIDDPRWAELPPTTQAELIDAVRETRSELAALRNVVLRTRADVAEDGRIRDVDTRQTRDRIFALEASVRELADALGFSGQVQRVSQTFLPDIEDLPR